MLNIVCAGFEVQVDEVMLLKLCRFQTDRALLASGRYIVVSDVTRDIFEIFIGLVRGTEEKLAITKDNCSGLTSLCREFGYCGLDAEMTRYKTEYHVRDRTFILGDNRFDGIIAQLTRECAGNVAEKRVVVVTTTGTHGRPCYAVDLESVDSIYSSYDEPGQWLCFDFKTAQVAITHYTLRTTSIYQMKSWVLEASNDNRRWTELDRKQNRDDLKCKGSMKTYHVSRPGYNSFVRLRMTGLNHAGGNELVCSAFEIFGSLRDQRRMMTRPYKKDACLDGIIAALTVSCGGNVHDSGVVQVTAKTDREVNNVVDLSNVRSYYLSEPTNDRWVCFDFVNNRVTPTCYSIRSSTMWFLKSWVLEGSTSGTTWIEIDRRENAHELNGINNSASFSVYRQHSFRFLRLRMTDHNHQKSVYFQFSAFEVFGKFC